MNKTVTLEEARDWMWRYPDSYTRLLAIKDMAKGHGGLSREEVLTLLGEAWESSDNIWAHRPWLSVFLEDHCVPEMMDEAERSALASLPESVTIYRGADEDVNEDGFSWSLDSAIARAFPFLARYRAARPVLVTATVQRDRIIAVKLSRKESEVITTQAVILAVEPLKVRRS